MNVLEILDEYRVHYDSSGRGKNRLGWANVRCYDCGRDPYLGISLDSGGASCWNCGRKDLAEVLSNLCSISLHEAIDLCKQVPRSGTVKREKKAGGKLILPKDLGPLQEPHRRYLAEERGLDPDLMVKLWGLQGIGRLGGKLAWRIFIPVYMDGEVVTWTTRRLTNAEPRYHAASPAESIIPIDQCIYGLDYCRTGIALVEGPGDVWAIGPGAGCTFGLRVSDRQLEAVSRLSFRGVLFDAGPGESEAQRRANALARRLSVFEGTTLRITLETGNDPGSCAEWEREEIRRLVR